MMIPDSGLLFWGHPVDIMIPSLFSGAQVIQWQYIKKQLLHPAP